MARIIEPEVVVDSNGKIIEIGSTNTKKDEPFKGIGMMEFKRRYDEILDFYYAKYPAKKNFYEDLKKNKHIAFTHSIPVFSALLRPSQLDAGSLKYESTNEYYMMLSKLVYECNKDALKMDQKLKEKLNILYDIQVQYMHIYLELKSIMATKKGSECSPLSIVNIEFKLFLIAGKG